MKFKENWKRFWTLNRRQDGFTLVELIVVIAILAILAGVAVPAYSGYVEKARYAADEQLLAAVNTAFAAACIENGVDAVDLEDGSVAFNVATMTPDKYTEDFAVYYAGNTDTFKTFSALFFRNGVFTAMELSEEFLSVLEKLVGSENVPTVLNSIFGDMGANKLMNKVGYTSDLAASLLGVAEGGKFYDMITNCSGAMASMMGFDLTDEEDAAAFGAIAKNMFMEKAAQLKATDPKYADVDVETLYAKMMGEGEDPTELELELYGATQNSISANNAILAAAQSSQAASEKIFETLKTNPTGNLIAAVDKGMEEGGDTSEGLAQVAMAYGLYTAYAERNNITVSDNPSEVLTALSDSKFQAYLETQDAKDDLAGYQASMNMINESLQGNTNAVADVLVNGFDDPQLIAVLQQAFAQGSKSE